MKKNENMNLINSLGKYVVSFALIVTSLSVNTACVYIAHQAKIPESAKKLQKL